MQRTWQSVRHGHLKRGEPPLKTLVSLFTLNLHGSLVIQLENCFLTGSYQFGDQSGLQTHRDLSACVSLDLGLQACTTKSTKTAFYEEKIIAFQLLGLYSTAKWPWALLASFFPWERDRTCGILLPA